MINERVQKAFGWITGEASASVRALSMGLWQMVGVGRDEPGVQTIGTDDEEHTSGFVDASGVPYPVGVVAALYVTLVAVWRVALEAPELMREALPVLRAVRRHVEAGAKPGGGSSYRSDEGASLDDLVAGVGADLVQIMRRALDATASSTASAFAREALFTALAYPTDITGMDSAQIDAWERLYVRALVEVLCSGRSGTSLRAAAVAELLNRAVAGEPALTDDERARALAVIERALR